MTFNSSALVVNICYLVLQLVSLIDTYACAISLFILKEF